MSDLHSPGLAFDTRSDEAKAKDYLHVEVAPAAVVLHWDRGLEGAPIFSDRDQNGSGTCVAQSAATALEILRGEIISAHPIYARRANLPGFGMWLQDAGNIIKHLGTTTEALDPSQRLTEDQMNKSVLVNTPINGYLYAFPNVNSIDQIAEAIEVRKHCKITINGNLQEYAYSTKPTAIANAKLDCGHCICGIYYFTDTNGEKCILIKESWGPNNIRLRILTETYLKIRGTGAMYYIAPIEVPTVPKPKYNFQTQLSYAIVGYNSVTKQPVYDMKMMNNYSVKMLQDILKYEGLMDVKISSTGNYLQATAKAVLAWQIKHQVASSLELNSLEGKRVGPKTLAKLNSIYS